jgi:hypothetical protein
MRNLKWLRRVTMTLMVGAAVAFGSFVAIGTTQSGAVGTSNTPVHVAYYLALGGSGSLGVQPTIGRPKGQPTHAGYANDLLALERFRWSGLQLVQLGCPGETTVSFLAGGDHCRPAGQSQLTQAVSFLHSHSNVVLVTIDLGFNNMLPCLVPDAQRHGAVVCFSQHCSDRQKQSPMSCGHDYCGVAPSAVAFYSKIGASKGCSY